jgi:hypothetical protein
LITDLARAAAIFPTLPLSGRPRFFRPKPDVWHMDFGQALTLALDPARLLRSQGMEPDPWQCRLLRSNERQVLLNCSRQSGKSTAVATLALHTALFRPRSLTLILSPSLRQSVELFRKVLDGFSALGRPMRAVRGSGTRLELSNGARVIGLPGKEATIRAFSGVALLVIDEAARVADDLYRSVRPMLAVSRGRLVCLSTPCGRRGFFWREWESGGPGWSRVRITWRDCPRITADFITEEERSLGERWVRQEYECSFEALEGLVYPELESRCARDDWPAEIAGRPVGGIDFGFRNPFCALWGVLDRDDVLWVGHERYVRAAPIHEHAAALPRPVTWYADPAGRTEREELRRAGLVVRPGDNDIRAGVAAVTARLRTGRLRISRAGCPNLLAEAKLYRYGDAPADGAASELPVDAHNHALDALRYLVSRLDAGFMARMRKGKSAEEQPAVAEPTSRWLGNES